MKKVELNDFIRGLEKKLNEIIDLKKHEIELIKKNDVHYAFKFEEAYNASSWIRVEKKDAILSITFDNSVLRSSFRRKALFSKKTYNWSDLYTYMMESDDIKGINMIALQANFYLLPKPDRFMRGTNLPLIEDDLFPYCYVTDWGNGYIELLNEMKERLNHSIEAIKEKTTTFTFRRSHIAGRLYHCGIEGILKIDSYEDVFELKMTSQDDFEFRKKIKHPSDIDRAVKDLFGRIERKMKLKNVFQEPDYHFKIMMSQIGNQIKQTKGLESVIKEDLLRIYDNDTIEERCASGINVSMATIDNVPVIGLFDRFFVCIDGHVKGFSKDEKVELLNYIKWVFERKNLDALNHLYESQN